MTKLTYDEFQKFMDSGGRFTGACACMGPRDGDEFCHCSNVILSKLDDAGATRLAQEWRDKRAAKEAKYKVNEVTGFHQPKEKIDYIRERRLARMKELGLSK